VGVQGSAMTKVLVVVGKGVAGGVGNIAVGPVWRRKEVAVGLMLPQPLRDNRVMIIIKKRRRFIKKNPLASNE